MREKAKIVARRGEVIECVVECGDACAACAAKKVCSPGAEGGDNLKTITLLSSNPDHKVGDVITVEVSTAMGFRAVMFAYLIPVAIIIGLLLVLQNCFALNDLLSGGIVLVVAALYFLSIKIFGLSRTISVEIVEDQVDATQDEM